MRCALGEFVTNHKFTLGSRVTQKFGIRIKNGDTGLLLKESKYDRDEFESWGKAFNDISNDYQYTTIEGSTFERPPVVPLENSYPVIWVWTTLKMLEYDRTIKALNNMVQSANERTEEFGTITEFVSRLGSINLDLKD